MKQILGLQAYDQDGDVIVGAQIISVDGVIEVWVREKKIPDADAIYSYASVCTGPGSNSCGRFGITSMRLRSRKKSI